MQEIADQLGKHKSTISRELKRGTTTQIKSKKITYEAYFSETGQAVYEQHRKSFGKPLKLPQVSDFIEYAEQ